jgi:hypothetical protein
MIIFASGECHDSNLSTVLLAASRKQKGRQWRLFYNLQPVLGGRVLWLKDRAEFVPIHDHASVAIGAESAGDHLDAHADLWFTCQVG